MLDMNNVEPCVAIGVPLIFNGLMFAVFVFTALPRMTSLRSRMAGIESRVVALENTKAPQSNLIMERLTDLDTRLAMWAP
jgi:hypothetical protein